MSDGFPSRASAGAILFHGEVDADADCFPASVLVSGRGRRTGEVRTRQSRESKALWTVMKAGQSIVVPGLDSQRSGWRPRQ